MQRTLSSHQIEAFYHDEFVEDQVRDYLALVGTGQTFGLVVTDIGGGCGFFAKRLAQVTGQRVKVVDNDSTSIEACRRAGVEAELGDALNPRFSGDETIACFNLILHHLIGASARQTLEMQCRALTACRPYVRAVFVHEYIYESCLGNVSGWLIFQITKSQVLSAMGRAISKIVPSLRANTFGVGVRFRAHEEWKDAFHAAGYDVKSFVVGKAEGVSLPLRLLLIKGIRRDSFLLLPRAG
jgi:hypothetical protein